MAVMSITNRISTPSKPAPLGSVAAQQQARTQASPTPSTASLGGFSATNVASLAQTSSSGGGARGSSRGGSSGSSGISVAPTIPTSSAPLGSVAAQQQARTQVSGPVTVPGLNLAQAQRAVASQTPQQRPVVMSAIPQRTQQQAVRIPDRRLASIRSPAQNLQQTLQTIRQNRIRSAMLVERKGLPGVMVSDVSLSQTEKKAVEALNKEYQKINNFVRSSGAVRLESDLSRAQNNPNITEADVASLNARVERYNQRINELTKNAQDKERKVNQKLRDVDVLRASGKATVTQQRRVIDSKVMRNVARGFSGEAKAFGTQLAELAISAARGSVKLKTAPIAPTLNRILGTTKVSQFLNRDPTGRKIKPIIESMILQPERVPFSDRDVRNATIILGVVLASIFAAPVVGTAFKVFAGVSAIKNTAGLVTAAVNKDYSKAGASTFNLVLAATILLSKGAQTNKVSTLPRTSKAKLGSIFVDAKGNYGLVTKGGRVVRITGKEAKGLAKIARKAAPIRQKQTEVARLTKTIDRRPLTASERKVLNVAAQKKTEAQLTRTAKAAAKKLNVPTNKVNQFVTLYKKYQLNPTKTNVRRFEQFMLKNSKIKVSVRVDRRTTPTTRTPRQIDVSQLDRRISAQNFKAKYGVSQSKVNAQVQKARGVARRLKASASDLRRVEKLAFEKAIGKTRSGKKLDSLLDSLKKKAQETTRKQALSKVEAAARRQGFDSYKQQIEYNNALRDFRTGNTAAAKTINKIQKILAKNKQAFRQKKQVEFQRLRQDLLKQAEQRLRAGTISIKNKKYVVVKGKRNQLSKKDAEQLLIQVNARLKALANQKLSKERMIARQNARKIIREIEQGRVVQVTDKQTLGQVKQLMNNDMYRRIKAANSLRTPKLAPITKAQRKAIIKAAPAKIREARIERKRLKRSFPSTSASRKAFRKQYVRQAQQEQNTLNRIVSGQDVKNVNVNVMPDGTIRIAPGKGKSIKTVSQIIQKKNIPRDSVQVVGKDGTVQILKTEKVTSLRPAEQKQLLRTKRALTQRTIAKAKTKARVITQTVSNIAKVKSGLRKAVVLLQRSIQTASPLSKTATVSIQRQVAEIKPLLSTASAADVKNTLTSAQVNDVASASKLASQTTQLLKQTSKLVPKSVLKTAPKTKPAKKPPVPIEIPTPKFSWDKKPPRGKEYVVNVLVRVGGKTKEIPVRTTPNRAKAFIARKVDNTTARSFDLKIIGITNKKDIKPPQVMKKFRSKTSRGSPVLRNVEKTKYAIDTKGEKRGLRLASILKRARKPLKVSKTPPKNVKKNKNTPSSKKRSKKRVTRKRKK